MKDQKQIISKTDLINRIAIFIASSISEEYFLGDYATSCLHDMKMIDDIIDVMKKCKMISYSEENQLIKHVKKSCLEYIEKYESEIEKIYSLLELEGEMKTEDMNLDENIFECEKIPVFIPKKIISKKIIPKKLHGTSQDPIGEEDLDI